MQDYYRVLGVPRTATASEIKDAYRRLALRYHPDRDGSPHAAGRFRDMAEAYGTLSDPARRRAYDAQAAPEGIRGLDRARAAVQGV